MGNIEKIKKRIATLSAMKDEFDSVEGNFWIVDCPCEYEELCDLEKALENSK